jgi:hypothetical protein
MNSDDRSPRSGNVPTVIVECQPLPLKARATLYRDGVDVYVPSVRRAAPDVISPRAKTHNYLNLIMGDLEARAHDPKAWAVLLDANGNLAEGIGSNIFLVRDGMLMTPQDRFVLPGVSRATVMNSRNRHRLCRTGHRSVRRLHRRRGVPDLDLALHLPGAQHPRPEGEPSGPAGAGHTAADRCLYQAGKLRFHRPVPAPPGCAELGAGWCGLEPRQALIAA